MTASARVGLIAIGYVAAFLVAFGLVAVYVAFTSGPDRHVSSGMYAFGDSLLFLAVCGVASVPASSAALFFLRPYRAFWLALSVAALAIAATGLGAFLSYVAAQTAAAGSSLHSWSALAVLRILVAPLFALGFLVSGLFAPTRASRAALFVATLIEATGFVWVASMWIRP